MQNTWQAQYFGGFEGCDGRRRFRQKKPTFSRKLVLAAAASAILLKLRGSQQGSGRVAVFGYVTAVEHNGKCKIRGRRTITLNLHHESLKGVGG